MDLGNVAVVGLAGLVVDGFLASQAGMLALSALLLLFSVIFCLSAWRSAGSARKARREINVAYAKVQSLATEVQALSAKVSHKAGYALEEDPAERRRRKRESTLEFTDEDGDEKLEAAKKAAIEPSALLTGFIRRR